MELYHLDYLEDNFHQLKHSGISTAQYATSRAINGMYNEVNQHNSMYGDLFKAESSQNTGASAVVEAEVKVHTDNKLQDLPAEILASSRKYEQEANKPADKVLRRLAQNREAARKSRLRKKAYVQQLESSRIKLAQLEQELNRTRQQGLYMGGMYAESSVGLPGSISSGIAAFEMEYGHWIEQQNRLTMELRVALQERASDIELEMLVNSGMSHYDKLFHIKGIVSKSEVFYLMSGMWKTPAERFFLWIGGFRPSELLKVLTPQLDPLTEHQVDSVYKLQHSSQQAEHALSQGLSRLQQTLAETLTSDPLGINGVGNYMEQMANAMGKIDSLVSFANQADLLRQQTLQQMRSILTIRQAARGLLALGDYFQKLRALSSLWAARPNEPA